MYAIRSYYDGFSRRNRRSAGGRVQSRVITSYSIHYTKLYEVPEPLIQENVMTIPGIDGRKMSKNYHNTIPIFADAKALRKQVMQIVTDSKRPQDPKNPDECNVFNIFKYFAPPPAVASRRNIYLKGGLAYSEMKQELYELLNEFFGSRRETYHQFLGDKNHLDRRITSYNVCYTKLLRPL